MRRGLGGLAAVVAALAFAAPAAAQQAVPCDQETDTYAKVHKAPRYEVLPQEVGSIPSARDGVAIQIGIVRPKVPAGTRVPVIVDAGPYYHPMQTLDLRACQARLTENFVPQGYAVALIAVRGTGDSGGCMDLFGPGERADLDQAITWLGSQPWSSGSVGMVGKSYDGGTQWEAAASGNPHLKTIVPVEGVPDVFELLFGNGTPDWRGPLVLNDVYYVQSVAFYLNGRSPEHTAQVTACPDYATGTAASLISAETGQVDPFGYWSARRYRDQIEQRYRGSILLVQGLQDWNVNPGQQFPWISRLERRGVHVKKLLGQWGHSFPDQEGAPELRPDWGDMLLAWFDRWLRGERSVKLGPPAQVEDSAGEWRDAAAWPPRGVERTLWATADGKLAASGGEATGSAPLGPDPVHSQGGGVGVNWPDPVGGQCGPPNCASFASAPFAGGLRFAGLPALRLTVTPSAPSGQVSAYLYAVGADGASQRLGWGQADLRFPHGEDDPQPVTAGQPMTLDLPLQPLDAVVPAGARLVLALSQGHAYNRMSYAPGGPVQLATGGRSSSLTFTEIHPAPGDFFKP